MTRQPQGGIPIILYDASCRLCTAHSETLAKLSRYKAKSEALQTSLHLFPEIRQEEAMREIKMVGKGGEVYGGAEAIAQLMILGSFLGKLAYLYYVPGLRWFLDKLYAYIAKNRFRFFGKTTSCDDEACAVHFKS